jgi:hypothetical protein
MTPELYTQLIAAIPPTLLALASLIAIIKGNGNSKAALTESLNNGKKLNEVHISLNSRLSELVKSSKAQGRQDERDDQADGYTASVVAKPKKGKKRKDK